MEVVLVEVELTSVVGLKTLEEFKFENKNKNKKKNEK